MGVSMRLWPSISIVFVIVIAGFLALYLRTSDGTLPEPAEEPLPPITSLSYEDEYEDGFHVIIGHATVPTRCMTLTTAAALTDGVPPVIRIDLSAARDEGVCLELPTEREFTIDIEAPEGSPIEIYGNGALLTSQEPT